MENKQVNELYFKKCNIIKELIEKKYKDTKHVFDFVFDEDTSYIQILINKGCITIRNESTWKQLEKLINKIIEGFSYDCEICCNKLNQRVSCDLCTNSYCGDCYINLFKRGEGIIKCPYCNHKVGIYTPPYMMDICINEIKNKF